MKAYVASPGLTGTRAEAEVDNSKRIDSMFYNATIGKHKGPTPVAYCYRIEGKSEVDAVLDRHIKEQKDLADQQYKEVIALRERWGL